LGYYGILTNCRDSVTGEYRKEVLLYHQKECTYPDHFLEFTQLLDKHEGFKLSNKKEIQDSDGSIIMWQVGNLKYSRKDFEKIMT